VSNKLEQLKGMTDVVADTGDIQAIERFKPMDATTNPSLLLNAAQLPQYAPLLDRAIAAASAEGGSDTQQLANSSDRLAVAIGSEILSIIPGRISTEVDSRLSFDSEATVAKAHRLIDLYQQNGIERNRVLIKIAATWEGICAAKQLEREGINCNLTLLFGFSQAAACADAGVYLISPFVGRILDWFKASTGQDYSAETDPGVQSVSRIYQYYKQHQYNTVVMGASFRNTGEIEQLAGCDRLTISPALLQTLAEDTGPLQRQLSPHRVGQSMAKPDGGERHFRWSMNEDAMATEKLAEGIRNFTIDQIKLEQLLRQHGK